MHKMDWFYSLLIVTLMASFAKGDEASYRGLNVEAIPLIQLNISEAFHISVNEKVFNSSEFVMDESIPIKFRPSILSMPDLPKWMKFVYSEFYHDGYLYGIPTQPGDSVIEVIATNMESFTTSRSVVRLQVNPRKSVARYEVQVKFTTLNVDDMFVEDRVERLSEIFSKRLWKTDVYVTLVDSPVRMGGRRPPNPKERDGVIVRIGSTQNFTKELFNLDREVMNIRNRNPCPKDYKNTLAERFFRDQEFVVDWCGFQLLHPIHPADHRPVASSQPIQLTSDNFHPPDRELPKNEQRLTDFLMCLILPTALALLLAAILSWIMFGRREGVEKRNKKTPNIQMVQYASIHRASANLRGMTSNRNGPTPLATTPSSTLQRSPPTSSPNNTLIK